MNRMRSGLAAWLVSTALVLAPSAWASPSAAGKNTAQVNIGEQSWEFNLASCKLMFRMLLTLRGQTADDSAEIAGAFTTHEEDRDGSGFQVMDRATDTLWEMVEGQTQFSLDDGTVTGSASFRSSRAPDQTVAGTFTICP